VDAGASRLGSLTGDDTVVEARRVVYTYGRPRTGVDGIDLAVRSGETIVLLGPNGSGKTTLLRLFAGDLRPQSGEILHRPGGARTQHGIGYASDRSTHFDELTGRENARWFVRAAGGTAVAADDLLARFGLADDADVPVGEYSFGMRRRIVLLAALAHLPSLVLLDEPTVGLDPDAAGTLRELLAERTAAGAAIVIATNDTRVAGEADRVAFLYAGRFVALDTPAALLERVRGTTRIDVVLENALQDSPLLPAGATATPTATGLTIETDRGTADLPGICDAVGLAGGRIRHIDIRKPGFDDVFRGLTGRSLAEAATAPEVEPADTAPRRGPPWRRRP
jgi:ABC-2 type transport system ATP-binding protein